MAFSYRLPSKVLEKTCAKCEDVMEQGKRCLKPLRVTVGIDVTPLAYCVNAQDPFS